MVFNFINLDGEIRQIMVEEIKKAEATKNIYYSKRFNPKGNERWPSLLIEAAEKHDEHWLAYKIEEENLMIGFEMARIPSGGYTTKHGPDTASETLADGQFNRFYMISICKKALNNGMKSVNIYRAKESKQPRPESEALIGKPAAADVLIEQLSDVNTSLRNDLLKPNSGLSVKL